MSYKFLKKITLFLLLQYPFVVLILMMTYKGGYRFHPEINYFVFDKTYLSDLGRIHYFSGNYNPYWWIYSITLTLVGIGIFLFFFLISSSLKTKFRTPILLFAIVSAIGYIGIAVNPVDIYFNKHIFYGKIAFFSFLFTAFLSLIYTKKNNNFRFKALYILNFFLSAYLIFQLYVPQTTNESILQIKVLAQKSIVAVQLIISILILYKSKFINFSS